MWKGNNNVRTLIRGTIKWEHVLIDSIPFYVVCDADGKLAVLHFRQDDSIEYFLSELIGCWNYSRARAEAELVQLGLGA
jgi:hypothetical protein